MMKRGVCLSILLCCVIQAVISSNWSYDDNLPNGPRNWGRISPNCNGRRQSPVNLNKLSATLVLRAPRIQIIDIDKRPVSVNYENDGHGVSVSLNFADGIQPRITGGPLGDETYVFHGLHIHWRSEHTVSRHHFDAEMHLVHFNSKYGSINEAITQRDGLAVLGILYAVPLLRHVGSPFDVIRPLIHGTRTVRLPGTSWIERQNVFSLFDVLQTRTFSVWSYDGSLTTPNCNEVVTWMVHKIALPINPSELLSLRQIQDDDGVPLSRNNRPIQPLNARTIFCY